MANQTQDVYYNVTGQTLEFYAPKRPSSITSVTVYPWDAGDDDTAESATTGSASVGSVNTTFDASSGVSQADPTLCYLGVTTSIEVGRVYLATNADGGTEWVDVVEVDAGVSVKARVPLGNDFASGDSFQDVRVTISVDSTWVADTTNITDSRDPNPGYRVRWVWVDSDSVTHVDFTGFDLVRYAGGRHGVTPADMEAFHPLWHSMLPSNHRDDGGIDLIDAGWERVQDDLMALDIPDQQLRNNDALQRITRYAAARQLHYTKYQAGGDIERYQLADSEYQGMLSKLFRVTTKVAIGTGSGGAGTRENPGGVWRR